MVRHTPATRRWTRTGTFAAQAVNPPAVTTPLTTRFRRSAIEIDRSWTTDSTVKLAELVPVPPAVVTLILPVTAPSGTVAVIWVAELTTKLVAATPPNFTEVAPVKPVPWIVTEVPTGPLVGVKDVIVGAVVPVKSDALDVVALVPLNFTELAPTNPEPLIVTTVPTEPLDGENDVIVGAHEELTVKSSRLVAEP